MDGNKLSEGNDEAYWQLFDLMPQLGWSARPDGYVEYFNKGWYDYTGRSFDEMKGWGWKSVVDPDCLPSVSERWLHALEAGVPTEVKFRLKGKDGTYRWFLTRVNPIHDESGKIIRWVGINSDIQDEAERLEAIAESEAKFRLLAETLPHIVWIVDSSLAAKFLNQRWAYYTGQQLENGLGYAWRKFVHPEDLIIADRTWQQCIASKSPHEGEQRLLSAAGTYRWFLVRGIPLLDHAGNVSSWFGTCTDIHDEKQAAARDNERFRLMVESMPVATWSTDKEGRCDYVNQLWLDAANTTLDKVLGTGWLDYLHPDDREPVRQAWNDYVEDDKPYECEFRIRGKNGYRWHLTRGKKVFDAHGNLIKFVGGCTDIHAQREQAQELERLVTQRTAELQKARDQAIAASQAKSRFLSTVSHEVRTPMSGVMGLVEIMCLKAPDLESRKLADAAFESCERLLHILNDLLDASKLSAGEFKLEYNRFSVRPVIGDIMQLIRNDAEQKKLDIRASVASNVPEIVYGAELRVRQVVHNLVLNAVKFTDKGSVSIDVSVLEDKPDRVTVKFSVTDTGIGISQEQQEKIFEPFSQIADSTTRIHGGAGLGLSISRKLVELMSGRIELSSKPGYGSTFSVVIPFQRTP